MKPIVGLYEQIVNEVVGEAISEAREQGLDVVLRSLDSADGHSYLAQYLSPLISSALSSLPQPERTVRQLELTNKILLLLLEEAPESLGEKIKILRPEVLLGILASPLARPDTPLSSNCLMTGTRQDPSLVSQLRKELASADAVDVLCSFIKWGGVRILEDSLRKLTARQRLRVITTSYMGATDFKAVELLSSLDNTELRVSFDTRRTRLHAKAYIIHRVTGFGVAYIGSSNLSQAALTDGLEWNVKISQHESPHIWNKVCGTFETYWNDSEFIPYSSLSRERLRIALRNEASEDPSSVIGFAFNVTPYPFQQEILDKIAAERAIHGRWRNLVVAATGTGKTVVAALDYARFRRESEQLNPTKPVRLLFVAHREEILKQSLACFRGVLRDFNFGDMLVGPYEPEHFDHLFVSIQSFDSRELWSQVDPEFYQFIVVDEFHHAAAPSYQRLLEALRPKVLLGLTATPERMDGLDILQWFDGQIAAEIRLPDAINRKLLCPFQYFGVTDSVDYSNLRWQKGGYVIEDLDNLVTGNDVRLRLVIDKVNRTLLDVTQTRGLGFCVSIRHAEFMAKAFCEAGIPSVALSALSNDEIRNRVQERLRSLDINFIFVVDLYNEGVDIPQIDTILMLRPTESLTVFLQQLGRGLRLNESKECLTVLDFIGHAHRNFSYESRFRALLGPSSRQVGDEIKQGFPHLPSGCVVNLERVAMQHVLDNIRESISHSRARLVRRIASFEQETAKRLSLSEFVTYHRLNLDEIYRRTSWSRLLVSAGIKPDFKEPDEQQLSKGLRRLAHMNAVKQLSAVLQFLRANPQEAFESAKTEETRRSLVMLHFALWGRDRLPPTLAEGLSRLCENPTLHAELRELLCYKLNLVSEVPIPIELNFLCPLELHCDYTRDEILAGLAVWSLAEQREVREGVLFVQNLPADLLFITLNKTDRDYSPTTMYDDYAVSEDLFHWQSQSTTSQESPTGQRYINHRQRGSEILLFVREDKKSNGLSCPYTFLGPADYCSHEGSRPMSILWRLRHTMPARLLRQVRRLAND